MTQHLTLLSQGERELLKRLVCLMIQNSKAWNSKAGLLREYVLI